MKKHINALLGFVCYTIGVIAAAYYGLWKMLVLPLHTLAVSFLAGDPDWETMEKEYMAEKEEKERQAS